tara:strand:+ start:1025 stop:1672 length:648 start_codon:yes stop_codon:yes gene_type:complete
MVKIKKDDLIEIDFVGSFKDNGKIFDLTVEKIAKEKKIFKKDFEYKPMKSFVGSGHLLKGIDAKLIGAEVGKEIEFDLKPADAFGDRDSKLIQIVSLNKLKSKGVNPAVGMQLNVDGKVAMVRSVNGGRVILDFNHPFSGKEVHYWIKPLRVITDLKEKVNFATEIIGFKAENLSVKDGKVKFKLANKEKLGQFVDILKAQVKKLVPEAKEVTVT